MLSFKKVNLIMQKQKSLIFFNELKNKFSKEEIKEIREKFDKYFKELGREYILKNEEKKVKKYCRKQEKNKQNFKELEENLNRMKKNRNLDNDDPDYEGIRSIENLFGEDNEEDYYKPIKTKDAFNNNYIEYESRGDKEKHLSPKEYLNMIKPYLRDMINSYKTPIKLKTPSGEIIDDATFGEWKIQLTMRINFISFLDIGEIRTMDSKSKNVEVLMGSETDYIIK